MPGAYLPAKPQRVAGVMGMADQDWGLSQCQPGLASLPKHLLDL